MQMIMLWKNTAGNLGIVPIFLVALLFSVAWLLVGIGLYIARLCPRWAAALVGLMQLVWFVSELSGGPKWVAVAAQVGFAIGLIPIGTRILRRSDPSRRRARSSNGRHPSRDGYGRWASGAAPWTPLLAA